MRIMEPPGELSDGERRMYLTKIALLSHAVQTGVLMEMEKQLNNAAEPKHLRTGVNLAMVEHSSLAHLLVKKKLITEKEYFDMLVAFLEKEVYDYEQRLSIALSAKITLG